MEIKKFLVKNYSESFRYIRELKKFIYFIILVFFIFALVGFFVPSPQFLTEQIMEFIRELLDKTKDMSAGELVIFIFLNNISSVFLGIALGFLLGILPLMSAILNGYVLGFVSRLSVDGNGFLSLWRLLPHGIFELTAVFISLGLGLKLGTFIFEKSEKRGGIWKYRFEILKENFIKSLKTFFLIVVPLLIIAAVIEGLLIAFLRIN